MRHIALSLIMMFSCNAEPTSPSAEEVAATSPSVQITADAKEVPAPVVIDETKDCPSPVVDAAILDKATAALHPSRKHRFLLWQGDYGDRALGRPIGVRVVFVDHGIRYTIWRADMFSIAERPNGTYDDDKVDGYNDMGNEGCVNFGISGSDDARRHMNWHDHGDDKGLEYHAEWQDRYRKALEALIRVAQ